MYVCMCGCVSVCACMFAWGNSVEDASRAVADIKSSNLLQRGGLRHECLQRVQQTVHELVLLLEIWRYTLSVPLFVVETFPFSVIQIQIVDEHGDVFYTGTSLQRASRMMRRIFDYLSYLFTFQIRTNSKVTSRNLYISRRQTSEIWNDFSIRSLYIFPMSFHLPLGTNQRYFNPVQVNMLSSVLVLDVYSPPNPFHPKL